MKRILTLCATIGALILSCVLAWAPNDPPCTPPTITSQPVSQTKCQGQSASFTVVATGTAPLTYQWRKNFVPIAGATSSTFVINNVQAGDGAVYSVQVSHINNGRTCTRLSFPATLTVNLPPTITTQPVSQTRCQGANVSFSVVATGTGTLTYQWLKNGGKVSGATTASLTLNSVTASDATSYSVVVGNSCGSVPSAVATLIVTTTDTDSDGLPDCWEMQQFGNLNQTGAGDPDYDGRSNLEEFQDGTNPNDPTSVANMPLGRWTFDNTTTWVGDQGQLTIGNGNAVGFASPQGNAVGINNAAGAYLTYKDVETGGHPNINCQRGTVSYWFKPDWTSTSLGGSGPQMYGTMVWMGVGSANAFWGMTINPDGNSLYFATRNPTTGIYTTHRSPAISWYAGTWHQVVVTYSATAVNVYIDGQNVGGPGPGIVNIPNATDRARGLTVGTPSGGNQPKGQFENLETFNYELTPSTIYNVYNDDTDEDGMPNGWEFLYGLSPSDNVGINGALGDFDGDEVNNITEYLQGRNPISAGAIPDSGGNFISLVVY